MNDKIPLGMIRVSANSATFEIPYFDEDEFDRVVVAVRVNQGFQPSGGGVFIPYHSIDWMVRIPEGVKTSSEMVGMTKQ